MPLQLLSRTTTDIVRSRSPSPLATPTFKPQIPTICLITATPCDSNPTSDTSRVAPWATSEASPVPIAPKPVPNGEKSRKRLVPKKSKLSLLGTSSSAAHGREQDFSDVVRRVRGASAKNGDNGFEIYVDPANDPDIGEILMVKKKKSRLALDGLRWGTLGEVTNVPCASKPNEKKEKGKRDSVLKMKVDENQKWWSIGRGRKDSKEKDKEKDKDRAKSPEPPNKPSDTRTRFNSLDSSILLKGPIHPGNSDAPLEQSGIPAPPAAAAAAATGSGSGKDSVAIRAMRSVRSLARIGSWAQLKNMPNPDTSVAAAPVTTDKESDGKKKKKKKEKEKEKEKERTKETIRYSGSSFEAGALTPSPSGSKNEFKTLGKKKASILGIGLPSTMRLRSSRTGSAESSTEAVNNGNHRLSMDSTTLLGGGILARGRSGSAMSTVSSLRPMSTKSSGSRESSGSSAAASVKWDEVGLETVKEIRQKDKKARRNEKEECKKKSKKSKSTKDSTRKSSSDGQKRTPLAALFPGIVSGREQDVTEQPPIATSAIQGATVDGESPTETPGKRVRPRPMSDQPLGRSRPQPIHEGDDNDAVMSLLDAATDDLAHLINRLDLEATPGSVEMTPMSRRSSFLSETPTNSASNNRLTAESPVKGLRHKNPSMVSLRPYAQLSSKNTDVQMGQNIAPWSTLNASISPSKPSPGTIRVNFQDNTATVRSHRRTMTPAPAADPSPVFKALRPATSRFPVSKTIARSSSGALPFVGNAIDRSPSAMTFGSGHSKSESRTSFSTSPVFKKAQSLLRKRSSLATQSALDNDNLPILPEARRSLGLTGTMGGSVGSIAEQDCDGSDPDSDIPDELQVILSNSDQEGDNTISFRPKTAAPPSPGMPPELPLPMVDSSSLRSSLVDVPVFRATVIDEDDHHADLEGGESEDDTKRSFDFTGELRKLRESGVSDRRSFIEQLENAFRTPAKIDLRYDFEDLPPIPKLPTLQDELSRAGECSFNIPIDYESRSVSLRSFPIDDNAEPSLLPGSHSFTPAASEEELLNVIAPRAPRITPSAAACPSNGELNRDFKFGGKPSPKEGSPLTLSDIIPPPNVARSLSIGLFTGDESSLMKSILANAIEVESTAGSKPQPRDAVRRSYIVPGHHRNSSVLSFTGLDSFAEVRRGFEFSDDRPGFYPQLTAPSNRRHRKQDSIYSIASVSSYGKVLHGGSVDPFDYASVVPLPSLRERPSSDDFSFTMSTAVDDTFCSIRRRQPRRRVDSDASSFYFRASLHPYSRSQRRPESGISVGPPISLLNRNSTYHRRGDSNTSMSSVANCRRFSWARPRSTISVDSVLSDFSERISGDRVWGTRCSILPSNVA
ncbi:hypothetical protein JVU11DRAFT_12818 [Chiua virens]|nr:hypothetical protein JVU11DRAFT_12818 [Chiua virens]